MNEKTGEGGEVPSGDGEMQECTMLHAAYAAFRGEPGKEERYIAVLEALEA